MSFSQKSFWTDAVGGWVGLQLEGIMIVEDIWPRQKIKLQSALALAVPISEDSVLFYGTKKSAM